MSRPPMDPTGWSFAPWPPEPESRRGVRAHLTLRELDALQRVRRDWLAGTRNEDGTAAQRRLRFARWAVQRGLYAG